MQEYSYTFVVVYDYYTLIGSNNREIVNVDSTGRKNIIFCCIAMIAFFLHTILRKIYMFRNLWPSWLSGL